MNLYFWRDSVFPRPFYFCAWVAGRYIRFGWSGIPRLRFTSPRVSKSFGTRGWQLTVEVAGFIASIGSRRA